jgi:hypothetical protein
MTTAENAELYSYLRSVLPIGTLSLHLLFRHRVLLYSAELPSSQYCSSTSILLQSKGQDATTCFLDLHHWLQRPSTTKHSEEHA